MSTLVQEFDIKDFIEGQRRIELGLSRIEQTATTTGRNFDRAFAGGSTSVGRFGQNVDGVGRKLNSVQSAGRLFRRTMVGIAAGISFDLIIGELAGFEESMTRARGITGATGEEFTKLNDLALELGRNTRFSSQEAAEGIVFLGQAGLETSEILDVLPTSLTLATAASTGLANSADVLSNVLSAFGAETSEAARFADVLTAAVNSSNANFGQLSVSLRQVAPIAAQTGQSLEETAAAIGVLGDNAIQGEQAGTALRAIILSLVKPSTDAQGAIEDLGLTLDDVNPEKVGIVGAFEALAEAQASTADQAAIFGREAAAAASVLQNSVGSVDELTEALENSEGTAEELAELMGGTLQSSIAGAQSAFTGLVQALGAAGGTSILQAAFEGIADGINFLTDQISDSESELNQFGEALVETFSDVTESISLIDGTTEGLEAALDNLGDTAADLAIGGLRLLADEIQKIFDSFTFLGEGALDFFAGLIGATEDAVDANEELTQSVQDLVDEYDFLGGQIDDSASSFIGLQSEGSAALAGLSADIVGVGQDFEEVFGTIAPDRVGTFSDTAIEEFANIGESILNSLNVSDAFGLIDRDTQQFIDRTQSLSRAFLAFGEQAQQTFGNINPRIDGFSASTSRAANAAGDLNVTFGETGEIAQDGGESLEFASIAAANLATSFVAVADGSINAQTALAGIGAIIGAGFGGAGGAAVGATAGGALGGLIGGNNDRVRAARAEFLAIADAAVQALKEGFDVGVITLFESLDPDIAIQAIQGIDDAVGKLNESLTAVDFPGASPEDIAALEQLRGIDFTNSQDQLRALASAGLTAADAIADAFGLSVIDVATVFARLPAEFLTSFDAIEANAEEITRILVEQFGLSEAEIAAVFDLLQRRAGEALSGITDVGDFVAISLANQFGVSIDSVQELFDRLPEGTFTSFNAIATNADEIARQIAVSFGLSFEEAKALILSFAEAAGISLSDVGTTADDLGQQILDGFSLSAGGIRNIFFALSRNVLDELDNIRVGADGTFRLVDDEAQALLESIFQTVGGTTEDIQLLLSLLASNADISFGDIFSSGTLAFQNLSAESIRELSELLLNTGLTAEQIAGIFNGIAADGVTAFDDIEKQAAVTLSSVLLEFGQSEDQIIAILEAIAVAGGASFSDLEGAAGEALRELLLQFGITEDQIQVIFTQIALGAESGFGDITNRGGQTAEEIQDAFQAALQFIIGLFGNLEGVAGADLAGIASQSLRTTSILSGSFANAANIAVGSINRIQSAANSANAAIARVNNAQRFFPVPIQNTQRFAQGGVITEPVALGGAAAGQAFQFGGVLPGLTSIQGGNVTPTSRLGIAGEAGEEGIFPLGRTSGGELGVKAIFPTDSSGGGGGATQVLIINGVDRNITDRLEQQLVSQAGSVQFAARQAAVDLFRGLA